MAKMVHLVACAAKSLCALSKFISRVTRIEGDSQLAELSDWNIGNRSETRAGPGAMDRSAPDPPGLQSLEVGHCQLDNPLFISSNCSESTLF